MNKVYLLLGSNIGDSEKILSNARQKISKNIGRVTRESQLYKTAAWGNGNQPDFINQVIVVETTISVHSCMDTILSIEHTMGRVRTTKNAPRIIDIDILYFNKEIINLPHLVVPHPAIQLRRFVLVPLNELSPNFMHPVFNQNNHALLKNCADELNVKKI